MSDCSGKHWLLGHVCMKHKHTHTGDTKISGANGVWWLNVYNTGLIFITSQTFMRRVLTLSTDEERHSLDMCDSVCVSCQGTSGASSGWTPYNTTNSCQIWSPHRQTLTSRNLTHFKTHPSKRNVSNFHNTKAEHSVKTGFLTSTYPDRSDSHAHFCWNSDLVSQADKKKATKLLRAERRQRRSSNYNHGLSFRVRFTVRTKCWICKKTWKHMYYNEFNPEVKSGFIIWHKLIFLYMISPSVIS